MIVWLKTMIRLYLLVFYHSILLDMFICSNYLFLPLLSTSSLYLCCHHRGGSRLVAGDPPSPTAIRAALATIVAKWVLTSHHIKYNFDNVFAWCLMSFFEILYRLSLFVRGLLLCFLLHLIFCIFLRSTARAASTQSLKGLFTVGMAKGCTYILSKVAKRVFSMGPPRGSVGSAIRAV